MEGPNQLKNAVKPTSKASNIGNTPSEVVHNYQTNSVVIKPPYFERLVIKQAVWHDTTAIFHHLGSSQPYIQRPTWSSK
jgi:hypothetical protein